MEFGLHVLSISTRDVNSDYVVSFLFVIWVNKPFDIVILEVDCGSSGLFKFGLEVINIDLEGAVLKESEVAI